MRRVNYLKMVFVVLLSVLFLGSNLNVAEADVFSYNFTGSGFSGAVGDTEFNDANFVINIFGDSNNVFDFENDPTQPTLFALSGTIKIFGGDLGPDVIGNFSYPLYVYVDNVNRTVGFGNKGTDFFGTSTPDDATDDGFDLLSLYIPGFIYDLRSSPFGPVFAGVNYPGTTIVNSLEASLDVGQLTSLVGDDVNNASFSVPEPASMLLLGSGLLALVGFRRKMRS